MATRRSQRGPAGAERRTATPAVTGFGADGALGPGVLIDPYLPQPGQHVGRRLIKIADTPSDYWLDGASTKGVPWARYLGIEKGDTDIWEVRKPELLTSAWFKARRQVRPHRAAATLRRTAVAVSAEAREIQATTGSLRAWAQGRTRSAAMRRGEGGGGFTLNAPPSDKNDPLGDLPGRRDLPRDSDEPEKAWISLQTSLIKVEHGTIDWPTTTWGGGTTEVEVDVAAPPAPSLFIIQVIGISSFLGDYGLGRTVKTMTLLPGEVMTMSMRTWRTSSETIAQGSSIIDSYDESSSERFAQSVLSETTDTATREKSENWHAEAEAKGSIGIASAKISGGGGGEYSASTEEFSKSVDEAVSEHAAESSAHRETSVTSSSERTVSTEDEEVVERTIKNINVKRTLNFTMRVLNQAFTTKTHLKDVRIAFSNGQQGSWREEPISGLRRLVEEVVKPQFVARVCQDILKTIAVVQDVHGSPVNVLEQVVVNKCATEFRFRDARPDDNCDYPAPTPDGRLYYRFKRGPLGQAPDERHPVDGVLLKERQVILPTDSVVADVVPEPYLYCQQLHAIPSDKVVVVASWQEALNAVFAYERIGTLVIVTHGLGADLQIGGLHRTLNQLAEGDERAAGLASWAGSAATLKLDGCMVGDNPPALLAFARKISVDRVEAWSLGRYIAPLTLTAEGNRAAVVEDYRSKGYFERAAPYMPKSVPGATYTAAELESELLANGRSSHFIEVFGVSFDFGTSGPAQLLAMPVSPFVEGKHFPRTQAIRESCHTDQEAADLFLRVNSSRLSLYQVVAEPR
jgi:hypothetical protein